MIYHHLFDKFRRQDEVQAAVIGAGHFGTAVVTQQRYTEHLHVVIVCDKNLKSAQDAFLKAGLTEQQLAYTKDPQEAQRLIDAGRYVYTDDAMMIMEVPSVDVVCEGTGAPEAAAAHCLRAIERGKHVAIISKELDSVVGPILKKQADERGVVYSPVDGDQPALLMQMVEWARLIGLTVISAGKARDGEFILDEQKRTVSIYADDVTIDRDYTVEIPESEMKYFGMIPEGRAEEYIARRAELLRGLPGAGGFDLCEMVMVANATGLKLPERPELTQAALRITELPVAYCARKNGGVYAGEGLVDILTTLRRPDESGMGGGVYLVVRCDNAYSNYILTTKGQIPNYDHSTAVIYRPYHLCGVEVATTLLCQGMLGIDTGTGRYHPHYDLARRAVRDIRAGEVLGNDHDPKLSSLILPATRRAPDAAIPAHMAAGNTARVDIPAGTVITYGMVDAPADSVLWRLRAEQERVFA